MNNFKINGNPPIIKVDNSNTIFIEGYNTYLSCAHTDLSFTLFNATTGGLYKFQGIDALVHADCTTEYTNITSNQSNISPLNGSSYCRIVAIGGGGGGGSGGSEGSGNPGGGGGGGGSGGTVITDSFPTSSTTRFTVTIGTGGAGGQPNGTNSMAGRTGSDGGTTTVSFTDNSGSQIMISAYGGKGGNGGWGGASSKPKIVGTGGVGGSGNISSGLNGTIINGDPGLNLPGVEQYTRTQARGGQVNLVLSQYIFPISYGNGAGGGRGETSLGASLTAGGTGTNGAVFILWYSGYQELQERSAL